MVASFPRIMFGPLYYRTIEKEKSLALKQHNGEHEAGMSLTKTCKARVAMVG